MADQERNGESFLSRWSRRKLATARQAAPVPAAPQAGTAAAQPASNAGITGGVAERQGVPPHDRSHAAGQDALHPASHDAAPAQAIAPDAPRALDAASPATLPPVDTLTFDSDFKPFLAKGVDPAVRQAALRKLLHDPRFNVMDGLDVYIDDYTKPSPLAPGVARTLAHARYLFSPPRTRVNAVGYVEDVPDDEEATQVPADGHAALVAATGAAAGEPMESGEPGNEAAPGAEGSADRAVSAGAEPTHVQSGAMRETVAAAAAEPNSDPTGRTR
jgi:hypothetical protein